ncbi:MAG TPA: hypothetical protein ENH62_17035 [Marinobacter sp.]|uniref:Uncharacterized protein n=1 Tax=marine sediment metagenome TaxID=412755 RepID=A0A0F9SC30_9ZZZZ|nr:hypothetical protein [Marinobacter sp.]
MSLVDFTKLQTTPGGTGPFAPSAQWSGSPDNYKVRLSAAVRRERERLQYLLAMMAFEKKGGFVGFEGNFAQEAREVYEILKSERCAENERGQRGGVR